MILFPFQKKRKKAAQVITPSFSDAGVLLERWYSQSGENVTGYTSGAFDILIDACCPHTGTPPPGTRRRRRNRPGPAENGPGLLPGACC